MSPIRSSVCWHSLTEQFVCSGFPLANLKTAFLLKQRGRLVSISNADILLLMSVWECWVYSQAVFWTHEGPEPRLLTQPNYRGPPPTSKQLMATDSLMTGKRTPYLFTGSTWDPSHPIEALWTLQGREERRNIKKRLWWLDLVPLLGYFPPDLPSQKKELLSSSKQILFQYLQSYLVCFGGLHVLDYFKLINCF